MMKQVREDTGIVHLRVPTPTRLREFLLNVDLSPLKLRPDTALVDEWLHYGSVYADGLRLRADRDLFANQIIRLHTRRKTYVTQIPQLRERIVYDHEDFLVLDKPSGLPTHATLDNAIENAAHLLSVELGFPLLVTSRLDVATRGLLIFAKHAKAQAALNKQFAKRQIDKLYRARVAAPVSLGLIIHWMNPESRVPKQMSSAAKSDWWECRMEILENESGHLLIRLHTGKTHQIRAQLSALGAPINGDHAYGSTVSAAEGQIDLRCAGLSFRWMQKEIALTLA